MYDVGHLCFATVKMFFAHHWIDCVNCSQHTLLSRIGQIRCAGNTPTPTRHLSHPVLREGGSQAKLTGVCGLKSVTFRLWLPPLRRRSSARASWVMTDMWGESQENRPSSDGCLKRWNVIHRVPAFALPTTAARLHQYPDRERASMKP
jgi:hypothetical protein